MDMRKLGEFIRERRKTRLDITQKQLADRAGLDTAYIVRLEGGQQIGSVGSLGAVAFALGVQPGLLVDILMGVAGENALQTITLPPGLTNQDYADIERYIAALAERRSLEAALARPSVSEFEEQLAASREDLPTPQDLEAGKSLLDQLGGPPLRKRTRQKNSSSQSS